MWARSRFETLAMPHLSAVYRVARALGGADRSDDLAQDTYLRAWKHFDQFDRTTNCRAWLCRILHTAWVSQWRRTRLELPVADIEDVRAEPYYDWEAEFLGDALSPDAEWALGQLPEVFRCAASSGSITPAP